MSNNSIQDATQYTIAHNLMKIVALLLFAKDNKQLQELSEIEASEMNIPPYAISADFIITIWDRIKPGYPCPPRKELEELLVIIHSYGATIGHPSNGRFFYSI